MRCLVLALLLLALPLSWGWAGAALPTCCADSIKIPLMTGADTGGHGADGHLAADTANDTDTHTAPAPCAHGCSGESGPCASDCPCQGHTPSPGALHYRPAPLHAVAAEPGTSEITRAVPEPFAATPLRPPSASFA
jgi:hypothetical protein